MGSDVAGAKDAALELGCKRTWTCGKRMEAFGLVRITECLMYFIRTTSEVWNTKIASRRWPDVLLLSRFLAPSKQGIVYTTKHACLCCTVRANYGENGIYTGVLWRSRRWRDGQRLRRELARGKVEYTRGGGA